jgi:1,4-alpha-glucan branching enzyme
MVDHLHAQGIGVLVDWVPAHFPRDAWALARFDGTADYEHLDPRQGEHPDWGTLLFNYGRPEVKSFLLSSARFWLEDLHCDGLRVDAVASMLYLDYSRKDGQWVANRYGGRENLEAIAFLRDLNDALRKACPGALVIAEESTAWPGVTRATYAGGLGFDVKWNMGWMHDTLDYFKQDPVHRRYHHHRLTFGMMYAYSEKFLLPLSHDEVVHMKGSLIRKMPGDRWQRFANLRALFAYQWSHPGRKLLFMGGELAQEREWDHDGSVDWHLLDEPAHRGVHALVRDLNRLYRAHAAFWEADDEQAGFQWIDVNTADANVVAFMRRAKSGDCVVCVGNFSGKVQSRYRVGLPRAGTYAEVLNTDAKDYGGSGVGNMGSVVAAPTPFHGQPFSAEITLPALSMIWLAAPPEP